MSANSSLSDQVSNRQMEIAMTRLIGLLVLALLPACLTATQTFEAKGTVEGTFTDYKGDAAAGVEIALAFDPHRSAVNRERSSDSEAQQKPLQVVFEGKATTGENGEFKLSFLARLSGSEFLTDEDDIPFAFYSVFAMHKDMLYTSSSHRVTFGDGVVNTTEASDFVNFELLRCHRRLVDGHLRQSIKKFPVHIAHLEPDLHVLDCVAQTDDEGRFSFLVPPFAEFTLYAGGYLFRYRPEDLETTEGLHVGGEGDCAERVYEVYKPARVTARVKTQNADVGDSLSIAVLDDRHERRIAEHKIAQGKLEFALVPGRYDLLVTALGHNHILFDDVELRSAGVLDLGDLVLTAYQEVVVRFTAHESISLSDLESTIRLNSILEDVNERVLEAEKLEAEGTFRFREVPTGTHVVIARYRYQDFWHTVEVTPSTKDLVINFERLFCVQFDHEDSAYFSAEHLGRYLWVVRDGSPAAELLNQQGTDKSGQLDHMADEPKRFSGLQLKFIGGGLPPLYLQPGDYTVYAKSVYGTVGSCAIAAGEGDQSAELEFPTGFLSLELTHKGEPYGNAALWLVPAPAGGYFGRARPLSLHLYEAGTCYEEVFPTGTFYAATENDLALVQCWLSTPELYATQLSSRRLVVTTDGLEAKLELALADALDILVSVHAAPDWGLDTSFTLTPFDNPDGREAAYCAYAIDQYADFTSVLPGTYIMRGRHPHHGDQWDAQITVVKGTTRYEVKPSVRNYVLTLDAASFGDEAAELAVLEYSAASFGRLNPIDVVVPRQADGNYRIACCHPERIVEVVPKAFVDPDLYPDWSVDQDLQGTGTRFLLDLRTHGQSVTLAKPARFGELILDVGRHASREASDDGFVVLRPAGGGHAVVLTSALSPTHVHGGLLLHFLKVPAGKYTLEFRGRYLSWCNDTTVEVRADDRAYVRATARSVRVLHCDVDPSLQPALFAGSVELLASDGTVLHTQRRDSSAADQHWWVGWNYTSVRCHDERVTRVRIVLKGGKTHVFDLPSDKETVEGKIGK